MSGKHETITETSDRRIVSKRLFAAPRERLFAAWSEPEQLKLWWGPTGFTNTFHVFEFHPGGSWNIIMHGPDGADYKNDSVFVEIVRPERIVFDHLSMPHFRMTATFAETEGGTELVWRMDFATAADFERVKGYVVEGNRQNFVRLAAHLEKSLNAV